jgi:hypothetical protein
LATLVLVVARLDRPPDSDSIGFAALKSAVRSFERWLTFCCIVMLLVQLTSALVISWWIDSVYPPA